MILDFNYEIKDVNGERISETANKTLANLLSDFTPGINTIKAVDWALKLTKDGVIEVDNSDSKDLKAFIENSTVGLANGQRAPISNIVKYHLLKVFDKEDKDV